MTAGATAPPRFPQLFIAPAKVPAYRPPISMVADQDGGIARSLKKLARDMEITAARASWIYVVARSEMQAPAYPKLATIRRVRSTLPVQRSMRSPTNTLTGFPNPPMN